MDKQRVLLFTLLIITCLWLYKCHYGFNCKKYIKVHYIEMPDDVNIENPLKRTIGINGIDSYTYSYNKNTPVVFIGGIPRSGSTLLKAMLDAHPSFSCTDEIHAFTKLISFRNLLASNSIEMKRLRTSGIDNDLLNSAMKSFLLPVIIKHGPPAERLCISGPMALHYTEYLCELFPNFKFILMIRDGRAVVHSMISGNITINGFNTANHRASLFKWSSIIEHMVAECLLVGSERCLPVYYERLVLHPETEMRKILKFLNWNDTVLYHERFIINNVSLSDSVMKPVNSESLINWVGKIPEDVVKDIDQIAPMLRTLGYDPNAANYEELDEKIKESMLKMKADTQYFDEVNDLYFNNPDYVDELAFL